MPESVPKKRPIKSNPLSEFVWTVYRPGYTWFRDQAFSRSGHLPFGLCSGVVQEKEEGNSRSYEPLKVEAGLFRKFANTTPKREDILEFANQYGLLGGSVRTETVLPTSPEVQRGIERWGDWRAEILFMRMIVDLWLSVQLRDEGNIKRRIQWIRPNLAVFHNTPSASLLPLPALGELETTPWVSDLDSEANSILVSGWVVHPDRDESDTIEYLRDEWVETALYFVEVVLNGELRKHEIESPRLGPNGRERLAWQHLPKSLIGALWLQFADAVANNRNFNQCRSCNRWFEIAPFLARTDKLYCSQTCRARAYRGRQAEARRLHALGSTIEDLVERLDSAPETIQRWLDEG